MPPDWVVTFRMTGVAARAREAAARAARADPRLAEAQTSLGIIAYLDWDWPAAEAALRRVIALAPVTTSRTATWRTSSRKVAGRTRPGPSFCAHAGWTRSTR